MRQLVTFGELNSDVDITGTGSMHAVVSRVAVSYGCPASFYNAVRTDVNLLHGKAFGSGTTN
jgi:hypothetical protein